MAIVDTNANPDEVTYPVPGNDDAIRAIRLFVSKFGEASTDGMERREAIDVIPMEGEQADQESENQEEAVVAEEPVVAEEAVVAEEPVVAEEAVVGEEPAVEKKEEE